MREAHLEVKTLKAPVLHLVKVSPTFGRLGFVAVSKPMAGAGTLAEVLYTCISCGGRSTHAYHRGRRSARDSSSPLDMRGGQGGYFLRGVVFWRLRSSGFLS